MNRIGLRFLSTTARRMALTQEQIAIVKSTAPVLKEHGETITALFYKNMLTENPSLKNIFNQRAQQTGAQPRALATAVLAYATHIDDLGKLSHAVERIAHKHASLFVEPAQYPIVGKYLMGAIGEVLGDALTPEIAAAWTAAYGQLADVFIGREAQLYADNGSWAGWRRFRVERRVAETAAVTTFYLAPVDGVPLPVYRPGQYVSLQVPVPQLSGLLQSRQYSLSEAPRAGAAHYRISVKRDVVADPAAVAAGREPGTVSNLLHDQFQVGDEVELSHPQGEFFVDPTDATKSAAPLVLVSASVGATPLVSILDATLSPESKTRGRPTTWIQCGSSTGALCFVDHVRSVCRDHKNVRAHVFVDQAGEGDRPGEDFDFASQLDLGKLDGVQDLFLDQPQAEYYLCGPEPWMVAVRARLAELGVDWERMHLELFATGDVPGQ